MMKKLVDKTNKKNFTKTKIEIFKKFNLAFLITTIVMISLYKSILMFKSAFLYYQTNVPWFEWLNYFILAIGLLILPPMSLLFLDSVYIRRLLRIYLFGIIFTDSLEFYEGIFKHISTLFEYERYLNSLLLLIEVFSALYCWIFLLRQYNGKSFLPIPVKTKMTKWYSFIEGLKIRYQNLKNWILFGLILLDSEDRKFESPNSKIASKKQIDRRKILNLVVIINAIVFSSLLITMIPENDEIVLERPTDHQMKIWFWLYKAPKLDNSTLDIMGANGIGVKAWGDYKNPDWKRYKDRNVSVVLINQFPINESEWPSWFAELVEKLNYFDAHQELPFVGFVDDMEKMEGIGRYNSTKYEKYVDFIQNATNYVKSRGYQYHITQWLASNNDLRDGDDDVSNVYENPFDPVKMQNLSSIDWMVYRSEIAILYDEPFEYFTYHWASNIRSYMEFIEKKFNLPQGTWTSKASMSIGVTKNSDSLYTFNSKLNPNAKQQFFKEVLICHASKISQITIFIAGRLDDENGFFGLIGGNDGLNELLDQLKNYSSITIKYKRRATFFGNLKMLSNITGSIFGLLYSDSFYDNDTGFFVFVWLGFLFISIIMFLHPLKSSNNNLGHFKSKEYKNQPKPTQSINYIENTHHTSKMITTNNINAKGNNKFEILLRIWCLCSIILVFCLAAIYFNYPQVFIILKNIELFLD